MSTNQQAAKSGNVSMTKTEFVKQFPDDMPPREVAAKAKEQNFELAAHTVSTIRSSLKTRARAAASENGAASAKAPPSGPAKRGPGRPRKAGAPAAPKAPAGPHAPNSEGDFLSLVLDIGLHRADELLRSVKTKLASLA